MQGQLHKGYSPEIFMQLKLNYSTKNVRIYKTRFWLFFNVLILQLHIISGSYAQYQLDVFSTKDNKFQGILIIALGEA